MGFDNVIVMIPFCRTPEEADKVLAVMAEEGLKRGEGGVQIYVMCEVPSNVILAEDFASRFDGFSIGSNDLTQLALGVDRDSEMVAFDYDESEPGVMEMFRLAIEGCRRTGRHSGFCGQAPSDKPEIARFLVEQGIDEVETRLLAMDRVHSIHHTHVWSMDGEHHVLTTHVRVDEGATRADVRRIKDEIRSMSGDLHCTHTTIEIEYGDEVCGLVEAHTGCGDGDE